MSYLKVENISKSFDDLVVLDNVSFNLNEAENLVIFGRSGTGKSVLLKCIIGLLKPDAGKVIVDNNDVHSLTKKQLNQLRKSMSFLFQSAALYDSMSVRGNLEFPLLRHFKMTETERRNKIMKTLDMVSLTEAVDKMPSELSGGMRKRIGLARSIITDPKLMLYDEPTTGLDPISTKEISQLILNLQKQLNMTSIAVTHDLVCAEIIADRTIFLEKGKIIFEGTIDELKESENPMLINFISNELISD